MIWIFAIYSVLFIYLIRKNSFKFDGFNSRIIFENGDYVNINKC